MLNMGLAEDRVDALLDKLDQKSRDILYALDELEEIDGRVETPDIKELTGIDRRHIHYRVKRHLEPEGLVDSNQPVGEAPGKTPPKQIELSTDGKQFVEVLDQERRPTSDIAERLDRLETQVESLRAENRDLREQIESAEMADSSSGTDADVDGLQEQIAQIAMELEELKDDPLFQDTKVRQQLDGARTTFGVFRDIAQEEFGEQRVREKFAEYEDGIKKLAENEYDD